MGGGNSETNNSSARILPWLSIKQYSGGDQGRTGTEKLDLDAELEEGASQFTSVVAPSTSSYRPGRVNQVCNLGNQLLSNEWHVLTTPPSAPNAPLLAVAELEHLQSKAKKRLFLLPILHQPGQRRPQLVGQARKRWFTHSRWAQLAS